MKNGKCKQMDLSMTNALIEVSVKPETYNILFREATARGKLVSEFVTDILEEYAKEPIIIGSNISPYDPLSSNISPYDPRYCSTTEVVE